jgi:hypothetical protein
VVLGNQLDSHSFSGVFGAQEAKKEMIRIDRPLLGGEGRRNLGQ